MYVSWAKENPPICASSGEAWRAFSKLNYALHAASSRSVLGNLAGFSLHPSSILVHCGPVEFEPMQVCQAENSHLLCSTIPPGKPQLLQIRGHLVPQSPIGPAVAGICPMGSGSVGHFAGISLLALCFVVGRWVMAATGAPSAIGAGIPWLQAGLNPGCGPMPPGVSANQSARSAQPEDAG